MKKQLLVCILLCFMLGLQVLHAQKSPKAILKKNVNSRASDLLHELNKTKDTLILKSHKRISYVYSINRKYKREIDHYINANEYKVPLAELSDGKHVMVVGQSQMKIVFVIWINQVPTTPSLDRETLITSRHN